MRFTNKHTEEEEMLIAKYVLLRKKRKALQQIRKNNKPATPAPAPQPVKRAADTSQEEAREMAKKVMAAQAARNDNKGSGFKRSTNLEKRLKNPDKSPAFHPFKPPSANPTPSTEETPSSSPSTAPSEDKKPSSAQKTLYDNFVSGGLRHEQDQPSSKPEGRERRGGHFEKKRGNTVFVQGYGLTDSLCKKALDPHGKINNISVNDDKRSAFVTFGSIEEAEKAIEKVNGTMVSNITLRVHMARRQPDIGASTNLKSPWTPIAIGLTTGKHRDKRELKQYSDDDYF